MNNQTRVENWFNQLLENLPSELSQVKGDFKKNLKAAINASLTRMELVTREEFDIQKALLSRTRAMLDEMEARVSRLEAMDKEKSG